MTSQLLTPGSKAFIAANSYHIESYPCNQLCAFFIVFIELSMVESQKKLDFSEKL